MKLRRTKNAITYHGRTGHPFIHTSNTGKKFVMVRKKGGGTRRMYKGSIYKENGKSRRLVLK